MASYWNTKLSGIVNITRLPDSTLINAYKAGHIYTHIVKDGTCLKVGEGPSYDGDVFDHDAIGIAANLLTLGDFGFNFADAQAFLTGLLSYPGAPGHSYHADDARYKYTWPWALYLEKTGDTAFVNSYFNTRILPAAHSIASERTGPGATMKLTYAVDNCGFWTVDNWSALMGLTAYKYICNRLANTAEEIWASNTYDSLLTAVNNVLSSTMTSSNINYIPPFMLESNQLRDPKDAVWASMFNFGRWAWDGYLFGASQTGVSVTNIDNTYDAGFLAGRAAGLAPHNFGAVPQFYPAGYSTAYNAGSASAALRGEKYRSEGIYAYQFMIANGQSGPFCWHETFTQPTPGPWGMHPQFGYNDSPHMWGQANATKVLIDSLIAERTNGSVIIGRGVPNAWVTNGQVIELSNFPIASNSRMGFNLQGIASNQIRLNLTGAIPSGGTVLDLRALVGNILSVTAGTPNEELGTVTLAPGQTTTTVTLRTANPTPIPTPTPLPTPAYTPPVGGTLIEAESGTRAGCYVQADPNASGGFRVDGLDANGDNVAFSNFPWTSVIRIRYATPNTGTFGLYVGGTRVASIPITSTLGWNIYGEKAINVTIPATAAVKFQRDPGDVAINLDCIVLRVIEMEKGDLSGGATDWLDYYASAGHSVLMDSANESVTLMNFPAANQFALRYSSYDFIENTTISLSINDGPFQTLTLPDNSPAGGGSTYAYTGKVVDINIPLGAQVKFHRRAVDAGAALYDSINLAQKLEAENAILTGGCYPYPDPAASNGYRVDGLDHWNSSVSFTNAPGGSRLAFRYATDAGPPTWPSYGLMSLYVSGEFRTHVFFPTTDSWGGTFADKVVATDIPPGVTVKLQFDNGDSPVNLDYIRIY